MWLPGLHSIVQSTQKINNQCEDAPEKVPAEHSANMVKNKTINVRREW